MTAGHDPTGGEGPPEEEQTRPVVRDRRRIDPETGKVRQPVEGEETTEGSPGEAGTEDGSLAAAKAEVAELSDQLARRTADVHNLQQEYNRYVRRAKAEVQSHRTEGRIEVIDALLGVLDEIELARQHGDLTGPVGAIAEKVESTLAQRFDVQRYGVEGEEFDPEHHDALMSTPDPQATVSTIAQVMQPGYRMGEKVLRAARVAVNSPE